MKKKERIKIKLYLVLGALFVLAAVTALGWRYYLRTIQRNGIGDMLSGEEYERHYVMIPEDSSSGIWQDIYASAKAAGAESGAYVELMSDWSAGEYTLASYIDIAIAENVDGIIVKPDGSANVQDAINAADAAGIPVVTVLTDEADTSRKSFVGINSYQLGTTYGRQVLQCIGEDTRQITVLLNNGDSGKDLIFKELKTVVQDGLSEEQAGMVQIDPLTIIAGSTFDAEEVIRDLFNEEAGRPDILVCMNERDSVSAYNAMVDYNQVGDVDIIGYYQSETMLDAVQKGTVPMVITLDTDQMGRCSVEALEEYYSMGYTSNYFSVDLNIITQQNAGDYLEED